MPAPKPSWCPVETPSGYRVGTDRQRAWPRCGTKDCVRAPGVRSRSFRLGCAAAWRRRHSSIGTSTAASLPPPPSDTGAVSTTKPSFVWKLAWGMSPWRWSSSSRRSAPCATALLRTALIRLRSMPPSARGDFDRRRYRRLGLSAAAQQLGVLAKCCEGWCHQEWLLPSRRSAQPCLGVSTNLYGLYRFWTLSGQRLSGPVSPFKHP